MSTGRPLAFTGALVFDGTGFLEGATVIVRGSEIEEIGDVRAPADAEVIDARGRTLLPGFIDAHVHIGFFDTASVLRGGLTTVRDLAWPESEIRAIAARTAADPTAGPAVLFAGQMITALRGYPTRAGWAPRGTGHAVAGDEDPRAAVRAMVAQGACVIKVAQEPRQGPVLPLDTLRAIVDEARANGLRVTSHCGSLEQLEVALEAGIDELAHGLWSDEPIPDETIERMVGARTTIVPTLHIDPSRARLDSVRRFAAAGGSVVYGTDMGNPPVPGRIDPDELRLMVEAGMGVTGALAAATSGAASHLGLPDRGRVAPGARADLVLVEGDPRADLRALGHPSIVVREGVVVSR